MKKIIMAVVALAVLGGGGGGAYMYFMGGEAEAASVEAEAGAQAEADHGKSGGGHGEGEEAGHYEYVELDPLILPIIDEYGISQVISLVVSIEVADAAAAEKINKMKPRLKDAYIQDMYGALNKQASLKGGVVQVDKLKARLNKVSAQVVGEDVIHDVLLQVVQQRPI
ncbi:MAG: flagellar basal body-associated FliL family protein [Rhodospirillales bacterium]|nr:flagellar basal body-associated FliL family protein [Rhodospirillales bacterium]MCB9973532.1 flagellar basal body-associated FliL family protein [Rhodospirillales bacterium]MCB9980672.1 flagellar basal body-associated FliL family protein [Rhodospirillales bacterium]